MMDNHIDIGVVAQANKHESVMNKLLPRHCFDFTLVFLFI
jgi:hypothetical protein